MLMTGVASIGFEGGEPLVAVDGVIDIPSQFVEVAKEVFGMVEFIKPVSTPAQEMKKVRKNG